MQTPSTINTESRVTSGTRLSKVLKAGGKDQENNGIVHAGGQQSNQRITSYQKL